MASVPTTFGEMIALRDDIAAEQARSVAFKHFHAENISRFLTNNIETFSYIDTSVGFLVQAHVAKNGEDEPIILDPGPPVVYQFIDAQHEIDFNIEYDALMARTTLYYTPPPVPPEA